MQLFYQKPILIPLSIFKPMTKTAIEMSVEDKLRALYDLQLIDSKIDELNNLRGELPLEVRDLENEVSGLTARVEKLNTDLVAFEHNIAERKNNIANHQDLKKKYIEQQKNIRNNREYNSLAKEIEFQDLEIQAEEKKIKEIRAQIEFITLKIAESEELLVKKKSHYEHINSQLESIMAETQKEEDALRQMSEAYAAKIDERLLKAYHKIRGSVRNGLAIVAIERGASAGSFFTIPPQTQVEIATRKKIIIDEHSGRLLVDNVLAQEEREKMEEIFKGL